MAIRIGHASIDENGKITGGTSGDQNGKEVCIRNWYNNGWEFLARPKSAAVAEKMALACEAGCANGNIGYDQGGRNTLNTQAKAVGYDLAKIDKGCECDCSSFMHVCAIAGGAALSYGSNGCTTSTMVSVFTKSGAYVKLTDSKYLTSDKYLRRGDILVKEGSHTVMALENGDQAGEATTTPNQPAAAAPKENTSAASKENTATASCSVQLPVLQQGSKVPAVKNLQHLLIAHGHKLPKYGPDGDFGKETGDALENYQRKNGLAADRKCGAESWLHLLTK